jgi:zinc and cadmium transporter
VNLLTYIVMFTALGGVLSVLAAAGFLLLSPRAQQHLLPHGVSFATGALLTGAFCGLLPHAFSEIAAEQIPALSATILAGILSFFTLEKLLIWRHCHAHDCRAHGEDSHVGHHHGATQEKPAGLFIIVGDSLHNFVDGVLIAAAFLTDVELGVVTSLAVAAHEIPQEVGDFAILLHSGYSRRKAFTFNLLSSLATVIGGVLAYFGMAHLQAALPYFLCLAASSFIYIAVADLIPTLHQETDVKSSLLQIVLILAGVGLIFGLQEWAHGYLR